MTGSKGRAKDPLALIPGGQGHVGANGALQFKVTLNGAKPPIWRRILVPAHYSFWDLHVAI